MAQKSVSFIDHPLEPAPRTIFNQKTHAGWWLTYPSEKYEFVTWDDDIPNISEETCSIPPTSMS